MPIKPNWWTYPICLHVEAQPPRVPLRRLFFEPLETRRLLAHAGLPSNAKVFDEIEPNNSVEAANLISLNTSTLATHGLLEPGDVDVFQFKVRSGSERLVAQVDATGADTRLSLLDANFRLLIQSEGKSVNVAGSVMLDPDDSIVQHLLGSSIAGNDVTYFLKVETLSAEAGSYELRTSLTPSIAPFQPQPVGNKPSDVVTADFNNDHVLDLAVTNNVSSNVSILLGLGDGTFAPQGDLVYAVGKNPEGLSAGFLNGDQFVDLAVVNEGADSVSVLYGKGDGSFERAAMDFAVGKDNERPSSIVVGQFGRGKDSQTEHADLLDIVTGNEATGEDRVSILFQDSAGVFNFKKFDLRPEGSDADAEKPEGLLTADFDQDGLSDLATLNPDSKNVSVLFGTGNKEFDLIEPIKVDGDPAAFVTGLFDGDKYPDLAVVRIREIDDVDKSEIVVLRFESVKRTFVLQSKVSPIVNADAEAMVAGQFNDDNQDGDIDERDTPDLAFADEDRQKVVVMLGERTEDGLGFQQTSEIRVRGTPESIATGDLNGDGFLDLVVGNSDLNTVALLYGLGDGQFTTEVAVPLQGIEPTSLTSGDYNRDGIQDFVTASAESLSVRLGRGDGTFAAESVLKISLICNDQNVLFAPESIISIDSNHDGRPDLGIGLKNDDQLLILLGLGDGKFQDASCDNLLSSAVLRRPAGEDAQAIVQGHFNNDRFIDLAIANEDSGNVSILFGRDDGFADIGSRFPVGKTPVSLIADHLNDDEFLDLVIGHSVERPDEDEIADFDPTVISVLLGDGSNGFHPPIAYDLPDELDEMQAIAIASGEYNSGQKFLAVVDDSNEEVFLLTVNFEGPATLVRQDESIELEGKPNSIVTGDFDRNGRVDLAVADQDDDFVSILLQVESRQFNKLTHFENGKEETRTFKVGQSAAALLAADVDRDGLLDLLTANRAGESVTFLKGNGDGTFQDQIETDGASDSPIGDEPDSMALAQFDDDNLDGRIDGDDFFDLVVANRDANTVVVLKGTGTETFLRTKAEGTEQSVGDRPNSIVVGQFNDDNADGIISDLDILDVAAANRGSDVSILMGSQDKLINPEVRVVLSDQAETVVSGYFDDDQILDIATANITSNDISVRLGLADGGFGDEIVFSVGAAPQSITAGHFNDDNGDGLRDDNDRLDLAIANRSDDNVSVLIQGTTNCGQQLCTFPVGDAPVSIVAGQFNDDDGNGLINSADFVDIATANLFDDSVSILLGERQGTFRTIATLDAPRGPRSILATQLTDDTGDGVIDDSDTLDLVSANSGSNDVMVWVGRGDGSFEPFDQIRVGILPVSILSDDFNGDKRPDLAVASFDSAEVSILLLLGPGDGRFVVQDGNGFSSPVNSTPLMGDLDDDGIQDVVILDQAGSILFRRGRAPDGANPSLSVPEPGLFDPPIVVNAKTPARDVIFTKNVKGNAILAAINLDAGANGISIYDVKLAGTVSIPISRQGPTLPNGTLPSEIESADLNGDGRNDLAVTLAGVNRMQVFFSTDDDTWVAHDELPVGNGGSELDLVDVNGDGQTDILVANQVSGDISLFVADAQERFLPELRFRAGSLRHGLGVDSSGATVVTSSDRTASLAVGDLNRDGHLDMLAANPGSRTVTLLLGTAAGGFADPRVVISDVRATAVHLDQFDGDGLLDVAVIDDDNSHVRIYRGDGRGNFITHSPVNAANRLPGNAMISVNRPTGLMAVDVTGENGRPDEILDLLVGNEFGDVLILVGTGQATFLPFVRIDKNVVLDVVDLNRPSAEKEDEFVFAARATDRVFVNSFDQVLKFDIPQALLAPSDVRVEDMNDDDFPDLVVAVSGENNVQVFFGNGDGTFNSQGLKVDVGTHPVGVTVADVNNDEILDIIVANEGSNDLSILLGDFDFDKNFTLKSGPRIQAGRGPVATVVGNFIRDNADTDFPDILVANSRSDDVYLLRGVGAGFFDDKDPREFPTGVTPLDIFTGDFNFDDRLDFITINFNSNNLTFYSDFISAGSESRRSDISSGGDGPAAAIQDDFAKQLLVAHNRNGVFSLVEPSIPAPVVTRTFSNELLPRPTSVDRGSPEVYGVSEGGEQAVFIFRFSSGARLVINAIRTSEFSALSGSSLRIVPVVQATFVAELQSGDSKGDLVEDASRDSLGGANEGAEKRTVAKPSAGSRSRLNNFLFGLEEAIEDFLREYGKRSSEGENLAPQPSPPRDQDLETNRKPSPEVGRDLNQIDPDTETSGHDTSLPSSTSNAGAIGKLEVLQSLQEASSSALHRTPVVTHSSVANATVHADSYFRSFSSFGLASKVAPSHPTTDDRRSHPRKRVQRFLSITQRS